MSQIDSRSKASGRRSDVAQVAVGGRVSVDEKKALDDLAAKCSDLTHIHVGISQLIRWWAEDVEGGRWLPPPFRANRGEKKVDTDS